MGERYTFSHEHYESRHYVLVTDWSKDCRCRSAAYTVVWEIFVVKIFRTLSNVRKLKRSK